MTVRGEQPSVCVCVSEEDERLSKPPTCADGGEPPARRYVCVCVFSDGAGVSQLLAVVIVSFSTLGGPTGGPGPGFALSC